MRILPIWFSCSEHKTNQTKPKTNQSNKLNKNILSFQPFQPACNDLIYAEVDAQYGPIHYKAASIYEQLKRAKAQEK